MFSWEYYGNYFAAVTWASKIIFVV